MSRSGLPTDRPPPAHSAEVRLPMTPQARGRVIVAVLVTLASGPVSLLAQVTTAEIAGTIVDESAGVLPGVAVTARNVQTGLERTATTNEHGRYTLFALPPGPYVIRAELPGFGTEAREGL